MDHPLQTVSSISTPSKAETVLALEGTITFELTMLKKNRELLKKKNQEAKTRLMSDDDYSEIQLDIEGKQKKRTEVKKEVMKRDAELSRLVGEIQVLRRDTKMRQLNLNDALIDYEKSTGHLTVAGADDQLFLFEKVYRVKGQE